MAEFTEELQVMRDAQAEVIETQCKEMEKQQKQFQFKIKLLKERIQKLEVKKKSIMM